MTTERYQPYHGLDDEELVRCLGLAHDHMAQVKERIERMEYEVIKRLVQREARELYHSEWECKLTPPSATYDTNRLYAELGEKVNPELWRHTYTEERPKTGFEPAKFNMTLLNAVARAHGKPVADALDAARLPSAPGQLKVTPRE